MMPSSWLMYSYRHSLRLLFVLGICPFAVCRRTDSAVFTTLTRGYTAVFFAFISSALLFLFYQNFICIGFVTNFLDTKSIILFFEFFVLMLCFTLSFLSSIVHSSMHRDLLNSIRDVSDEVLYFAGTCTIDARFMRRALIEHLLTILVYFIVNVLGWLYFEDYTDFYSTLLYFASGWAMMTVSVAVMHIRHMAKMIIALFRHMYMQTERMMLRGPCNADEMRRQARIQQMLEIFTRLFGLRSMISRCFGTQLLLNEMKDFVLITTATFYLITSTLYVQFKFSWELVLFSAIYLLPNVVKNVILARVMHELGDQTADLQRIAKKIPQSESSDLLKSFDMLLLYLQHIETHQYATANDMFPMNRALMFQIIGSVGTHIMILLQFQVWEDEHKTVDANGTAQTNIQSLWVTTWCGSEHHRHHSLARHPHSRASGDARPSAQPPSAPATPSSPSSSSPSPALLLLSPSSSTSAGGDDHHQPRHRQHYQIPCGGSQSSHRLIATTPTDDMDDMFLQCNKNAIYVLNTSYRYGDLDMINLFGSPAGRALAELDAAKHFAHDMHNNHTHSTMTTTSAAAASTSSSALLFTASHQPPPDHLNHHQQHNHHQQQHRHLSPQPYSRQQQQPPHDDATAAAAADSDTRLRRHQQQNDIIKYGCGSPSSSTADKSKKSLIFKSNVIAKKAKFWKFLEDDDKSKKNSLEDLSSTSSGKSSSITRWRRGNQKSSSELYREAAQMLGLSCTLSDSCRCLDCQSRYFDCDDSDTFSENSFSAGDLEEHFAVQPSPSPQQHPQQHQQQQHHRARSDANNCNDNGAVVSAANHHPETSAHSSKYGEQHNHHHNQHQQHQHQTVTNPNYCNNNSNWEEANDSVMTPISTPPAMHHQHHDIGVTAAAAAAAVSDSLSSAVQHQQHQSTECPNVDAWLTPRAEPSPPPSLPPQLSGDPEEMVQSLEIR